MPHEALDYLQQLRVPTVMWIEHVEDDIETWVIELGKKHDYFFTSVKGMVKKYKDAGIMNCFYLPQGYQPEVYIQGTDNKIMDDTGEYILFTGKIHRRYEKRAEILNRIVGKGYRLRWYSDPVPWTWKNIGFKLKYPRLNSSHCGKPIYLKELVGKIQGANIVLGFQIQPEIELCMSNRIWTTLGCGGFFLCEYVKGMENIFTAGMHLDWFKNEEELFDKIEYYWKKPELRRKIASAGQDLVISKHKYSDRFIEMFEIINQRYPSIKL